MGRTIFSAALVLGAVLFGAGAAEARGWQCVTYARAVSDFDIRGNAHTWWGQAEGRYERGNTPQPGAVLAMKSNAASRLGHVAIVREVVSDREIRIDHANWTRRGGVERNARVIDVSEAGDWSAVRVSYGSGMGTRTNPVYGFIYPSSGPRDYAEPRVEFASLSRAGTFSLAADIRALAEQESGR